MTSLNIYGFGSLVVAAVLLLGCGRGEPAAVGEPLDPSGDASGDAGAHGAVGPRLEISWRLGGGLSLPVTVDTLEGLTRAAFLEGEGAVSDFGTGIVVVAGRLDAAEAEHQVVVEGDVRGGSDLLPLHAGVAAGAQVSTEADLTRLVRNATGDLARALGEMVALSRKDAAAWKSALRSSEPDIQVLACRLLAARRVQDAIGDIAPLLRDPRAPVAEAAAGALVAIGSEDAVPLLLSHIERGNLRSEVRVIEALGKIGGPEAVSYLEMVAEGHEIPEVRRVAAIALESARSDR